MKEKGRRILTIGFLAIGLSLGGLALASPEDRGLPAELVGALRSGSATVVFYGADGEPVWTSALGLEPRDDLLAAAVRVVVYDAEGNVLAEFEVAVTPGGDPVVRTPAGAVLEAEDLAEAALEPGEHARERYRERHEEREEARHEEEKEADEAEDDEDHEEEAAYHGPAAPGGETPGYRPDHEDDRRTPGTPRHDGDKDDRDRHDEDEDD